MTRGFARVPSSGARDGSGKGLQEVVSVGLGEIPDRVHDEGMDGRHHLIDDELGGGGEVDQISCCGGGMWAAFDQATPLEAYRAVRSCWRC
jgi:hypothetical protein